MIQWLSSWIHEQPKWLFVAAASVMAALAVWGLLRSIDPLIDRALSWSRVLKLVRAATRRAAMALMILLSIDLVMAAAPDNLPGMSGARQALTVALVGCITWLLIRCAASIGETVLTLRSTGHADNLAARRLVTQTRAITRSVMFVIGLSGFSLALMIFPSVRHVGESLLASAGLAGIVAGLAVRPMLGNLIAGLQIGLTQPIRLDDVVIVEGEWGWVEEITGTYVVVRLWDQRRMVVPLEWWTQHPFQNWTRTSAEIIGSVFLWVDYRMPLEPLRQELSRVCQSSVLWDGRVCLLQVTEAGEHAMQLRCLVSSADSPRNWDLRCEVREKLLAYVQSHYPGYLPHLRGEGRVMPAAQAG